MGIMQKHAAACVCVKILRAVPFPHTVIRTGEMEKYDEIDGQAFGVGSFCRAFVFRALRFWCTRTHFRPRAPLNRCGARGWDIFDVPIAGWTFLRWSHGFAVPAASGRARNQLV